jgi:hypothetical protein
LQIVIISTQTVDGSFCHGIADVICFSVSIIVLSKSIGHAIFPEEGLNRIDIVNYGGLTEPHSPWGRLFIAEGEPEVLLIGKTHHEMRMPFPISVDVFYAELGPVCEYR